MQITSSDYIFGFHSIIEAIRADSSISKIYLQKGLSNALSNELEHQARKANISISYVPYQKLDSITHENHQGAIALISPIHFWQLESLLEQEMHPQNKHLFLILDGVTDVRNFGAIIRTAECCGVNAIVITQNNAAPVNGITLKTSAGAAFHLPIAKVNHVKDAVFLLQSYGVQVLAASEKTDTLIYNFDLTKSTAIIMGSEEKGVNPSVLKIVDGKAKLPLLGSISSLNVSVACGAILYEAVRQRLTI